MDSYDIGKILGQLTFWIILIAMYWYIGRGIGKLYKYIKSLFVSNPTKELLKKYLFWVEFAQDVTTTDEFRKKLKKIKDKKVYKGEFNRIYLTLDEASAQQKEVEEITIKEVLDSKTYPLFLMQRLIDGITLYDKKDLKNITKDTQMVWLLIKDIYVHMILKNGKFIYPNDYPIDNKFRFGYTILYDKNGLMGVYDIDNERQVLNFKYKYIKSFANIVEISEDEKTYDIIDLENPQTLSITNKNKTFPKIEEELKERINLFKIELQDYIKLFQILKSQYDLEKIGLWNAKVGVMKVPSGYEEIIEDSNYGTIMWNQYCSADVYDMSIELPVDFIKKDGNTVSLGIDSQYLILEDRGRLEKIEGLFLQKNESKDKADNINSFEDMLKRDNMPEEQRKTKDLMSVGKLCEYRVVPNWLKLKNQNYNDVDISDNSIDDMTTLTKNEFREFVNYSVDMEELFIYLIGVKPKNLAKFFIYLENNSPQHYKKQFQENILKMANEDLSFEQKAQATLKIPLLIKQSKYIYNTTISHITELENSNYINEDEHPFLKYEERLNFIVWGRLDNISLDFNSKLEELESLKELEDYDKFCKHLAFKFGWLIVSLHQIVQHTDKCDSNYTWFKDKFMTNNSEVNPQDTFTNNIIYHQSLLFTSITEENEDDYFKELLNITKILFQIYPTKLNEAQSLIIELFSFVKNKEMTVKNANEFLDFFENLPKLYENIGYKYLIDLKNTNNHWLREYEPYDNKIFDNKDVKNKLILLNYLVDMEDLYYESRKDK